MKRPRQSAARQNAGPLALFGFVVNVTASFFRQFSRHISTWEKELNRRRQTLKPLENQGFFRLSLLYRNGTAVRPYIILFDFLFQTVTPCGDIFIVFFFKSIHPCCGGKSKACVLKSLFNGNTVTFSYIAAAAASLDGHTAAWTIQSHLTGMDWKNTIVFQKCNSLSSCIPCQYPMFSLSVRYFRGGCSIYLKLNSRLLDIILLICSFHVLYKPFCILMISTFWRHGIAS